VEKFLETLFSKQNCRVVFQALFILSNFLTYCFVWSLGKNVAFIMGHMTGVGCNRKRKKVRNVRELRCNFYFSIIKMVVTLKTTPT
jgi:hypothetical protein